MCTKYHYKRVDIRGGVYDTLLLHADLLLFDGSIVLKQYRRRNYFVVRASCLNAAVTRTLFAHNPGLDLAYRLAETALHQTAERFDTLEQAMLYFEMVKS